MSEHNSPLDPLAIGAESDPLHQVFTAARLYAHEVETGGPVSSAAALTVLRKLPALRDEMDRIERAMTETLLDWGGSWDDVARETGRSSKQAAQQRYSRIGGTRRWPTRRPAATPYAPVDHPGIDVPAAKRPWSRAWSDYRPVDITPPELRPDALRRQVPDWAEPAASPDEITDWATRAESAIVSFGFDDRGWPLHPDGRTGRTGRNLGRWGENAAADPIVVAGTGADRRVLLIERGDVHQWAIPGGMVDPGETAPATLVRELREETGVDVTGLDPVILGREVVDDWRTTDHAWVASTAALFVLPTAVPASAADDAVDEGWFPFSSLPALEDALRRTGRVLYPGHRPLLSRALDHLDR